MFKIIKKIAGIFGFKLVDKNLIKNDRELSKYSLFSLNKILHNLFSEKKINNGHRPLPGSSGSMFSTLDEIPAPDYDYKSHYTLDTTDFVLNKNNNEKCTYYQFKFLYKNNPLGITSKILINILRFIKYIP